MGWKPPERPEWVRAVNAGEIAPIADEARAPLERDALLGEALARCGRAGAGLAAFGDEGFLEPLDVLLAALEREAELSLLGRWLARRFLLRLLEGRVHMQDYLRADPGVVEEEIRAPIFVTGAPRTGTTILFAVLVQDRSLRPPLGWELLRPVPPPDPATAATDPRVALAEAELRMLARVDPAMDAIHEYGARQPKECLSAMSFEFRSEEFTARHHVPSYAAWLKRCDMRPAYAWHRRVLQVLQRRTGASRWMLKSPVHLQSLATLLEVYPDARIAVTHRDPLRVLGSVTSLVANLRWVHSEKVDFAEIARYHADLYHASLDHLAALEERGWLPPERLHHGRYADFVANPLEAVRALYRAFALGLAPETESRMRAALAARPKDLHGEHRYAFEDLGLDRDTEVRRFARYRERFRVPGEV